SQLARHEERTAHVDVPRLPRWRAVYAGVVHQHVEPLAAAGEPLAEAGDRLRRADVQLLDPAARQRGRPAGITDAEQHVVSLARQLARHLQADAAPRSGDQGSGHQCAMAGPRAARRVKRTSGTMTAVKHASTKSTSR